MSDVHATSNQAVAPRLKLTGHEDVPLVDPSRGLLIEKGHMAVYLVRMDAGRPVGARRYLFTVREGSVLCGRTVPWKGVDHALLAVTLADCECLEVSTAGWGKEEREIVALSQWCEQLGRGLLEQAHAEYAERAETDGSFSLGPDNRLRPPVTGLYVLRLGEGCLVLGDLPGLDLRPVDGPMVVIGDNWFSVKAASAGRFEFLTSESRSEDLPVALGNLTERFVLAECRKKELEDAVEVERLKRLAVIHDRTKQDAVNDLAFAPDQAVPLALRETPLLTCLDAIAESSGIKLLTEPVPKTTLPVLEQLHLIARSSGTRVRRVKLQDDWWASDSGTLLAFKKESKVPVALINVGRQLELSRHYEIVDPEAATRERFDPLLHGALESEAYSFLRPLPVTEEPLGFGALGSFTFKPFLKDVRLMLLLSLAGGLLGAAMPMANRLMMDDVIPNANRSLLYDLGIGLAIMSTGLFFYGMAQGLVSLRIKTAVTAHLQAAVIDRLLRLPARFFRKYSTGDLLNRAMMISEVSAGFSMTVMSALLSLFSTVVMLGLCFMYSRPLALLAVVAALVTAVCSITVSFFIRKLALEMEIGSGKLFGTIVQMVGGVSKIQTAGAESRAFNQWAGLYGHELRLSYRVAHLSHWSSLVNTVIQSLSTIALYYLSGKMVEESEQLRAISPMIPPLLTIGTFFAVQGAFSAVVGGVCSFFGTFLTVHQQMEKRKLVRPILDEAVECGVGRINPGRLDGHIQVKNVCFRYGANSPLVLNQVEVEALPGEFIAIVGSSGSGKSTLLKLLLGFETAESGQVLFDRKDVRDLDMTLVRRQTGVVLQDGKINAGTMFVNISGAATISLDDAWEAAEAAGLAEEIRGMPMKMHTVIPEGATTLSGGQRQRLLIARAMALKPRVMFFDEATSALDNRTQEIVSRNLGQRRITRIVIAHRLSTIQDADRIYVMDQGQVVQKGRYEDLMKVPGPFKDLASHQIG